MKLSTVILALALAISGCAYNLTLMPRDSGKMYQGEMKGDGTGSGTLTVQIDGDTCTGLVARVASNQTFGFANTYGANNQGTRANAFTTTSSFGDVAVKGILSCQSGKGIRCDMTGQGSSGGGICVDDAGKVYDVIAIRK